MDKFKTVPVKQWSWQVYPPKTIKEWLFIPIKRIVVGHKCFLNGKEVMTVFHNHD